MNRYHVLLLVVISMLIAACSTGKDEASSGDPKVGRSLFQQGITQKAPACSSCHSLEPGRVIVGPSLAGVASRASGRKPDMSAEAYLRESILDPNAYIVEEFPEGVMYQHYKEVLSDDDLDDLTSFLLTLK